MKKTDAIIIVKNYLWVNKIEMSHKEKEAFEMLVEIAEKGGEKSE